MDERDERSAQNWISDGWAGVDAPIKEQTKAQYDAALADYHMAVAVTKCYGTTNGKRTLEWMRKMTVDLPCFVPGNIETNPFRELDAVHQGFLREGQNSLFREILRMFDVAEAGPPNVQKPEPEPQEDVRQ